MAGANVYYNIFNIEDGWAKQGTKKEVYWSFLFGKWLPMVLLVMGIHVGWLVWLWPYNRNQPNQ